jgi:hypothetical protein
MKVCGLRERKFLFGWWLIAGAGGMGLLLSYAQ